MLTLTARAMLDVWEQALALPPSDRALFLWASLNSKSAVEAREVTVSDRDRGLMAVYRSLFGDVVAGAVNCPQCHDMLEIELDLLMFDFQQPAAIDKQFHTKGVVVEWRLPTARDLSDVSRAMNGKWDAQRELINRCVRSVRREGQLLEFHDWPAGLVSELATVMTNIDPLIDPQIELACSACGHVWSVIFDIATFLWREIDEVARRLLNEVHCLASAYGWNENTILELTAARRAAYLRTCNS